ncbi:MAG: ABC transporter permease [Solirubrobacterales bacterium]|nr:ABC transporter permease [Solirubrobacterales bacterium]
MTGVLSVPLLLASANDFSGAFKFIGNNPHLLLTLSGQQMVLSGAAIGAAMLFGVPLGLVLGHLHKGSFVAINLSNVLRAVPSLGLLAIMLALISFGFLPAFIAMFVLAFPPILTNVYVAVDGVDPQTVDSARGMGMSPFGVASRVELPLALPLIFAGLRTAAVFVIASATIASVVGGNGLGNIIFNQPSYGLAGVLGAAITVTILSLLVQGVLLVAQRYLTPRGLRVTRARGEATALSVAPGGAENLLAAGTEPA